MKMLLSFTKGKSLAFIIFLFLLNASSKAQFIDSLALFVVANDVSLNVAEEAIYTRLSDMGFIVEIISQDGVSDASTEGNSLILISATVNSGTVATNMPGLRDLEIPVIIWEPALYDDIGFQEAGSGEFNTSEIEIVRDDHPLAAGFVAITSFEKAVTFGTPAGDAIIIAVNTADPAQVVLFGYDKGDEMFSGPAPARRVGTFLLSDAADALTEDGWALFDESVIWAMGTSEGSTSVEDFISGIPAEFILHNNYPNPFNPGTVIRYGLPTESKVTIKIFNLLDRN